MTFSGRVASWLNTMITVSRHFAKYPYKSRKLLIFIIDQEKILTSNRNVKESQKFPVN